MRPRISIRGCVRPSVRPSVRRSVRDAFVKIAENGVMQDGDASYVVYTALFYGLSEVCERHKQKVDNLYFRMIYLTLTPYISTFTYSNCNEPLHGASTYISEVAVEIVDLYIKN